MDYEDYFEIKHISGEVSLDEFILEAMRTDMRLNISQESIDNLNMHRITLKNEVLTCYEFLKEKGFLQEYHMYRDGEQQGGSGQKNIRTPSRSNLLDNQQNFANCIIREKRCRRQFI